MTTARRLRRVAKNTHVSRENFDYTTEIWSEGSVQADGRYSVLWAGGGTVQITAEHTLRLESSPNPSSNGWGDTSSSLVVSRNSVGDFDETVRLRTLAQLRNEATPLGSRGSPNAWEVAWFGWHFVRSGPDNAFYYVVLKPTGLELGKVDQRLRNPDGSYLLAGGQRFLYTDSTPYPIGAWYTLRVRQTGATIEIWINGSKITTYTDGPGSWGWNSAETVLTSGGWAYYHEDARVEFDDCPVVPPIPTQQIVAVSTAAELSAALSNAIAGQTIQLADGTYSGNFVLRAKNGTASQPIIIQGSSNAIIDGGATSGGYAMYVDACSYIALRGFQITGAQKSVVFDQVQNSVIDGCIAHDCGAESMLLRNLSCDNRIQNCEIYHTGLVSPGYGEGIYIGMYYGDWTTAKSRTGGAPDASDRNQILFNNIHDTAAECIDIKEGTSSGIIRGNTLEGSHMSGINYADSWIDIAGCGYTVENNTGTAALLDGIQTHTQPAGILTASNNIFRSNTLVVNAGGFGINIDTAGTGNVVYTSNIASGAASGLTNIIAATG